MKMTVRQGRKSAPPDRESHVAKAFEHAAAVSHAQAIAIDSSSLTVSSDMLTNMVTYTNATTFDHSLTWDTGRTVTLPEEAVHAASSRPLPRPSRLIAVDQVNGVFRVRLNRTKTDDRGVLIGGRVAEMSVSRTTYLDGQDHITSAAGGYFQEQFVSAEVVPVRTKDITDFGRLSTAAKSLASSMAQFGPANEPSPEQVEVFVNGYRNLLAWSRRVHEQVVQADGQIDAVEAMLARLL